MTISSWIPKTRLINCAQLGVPESSCVPRSGLVILAHRADAFRRGVYEALTCPIKQDYLK